MISIKNLLKKSIFLEIFMFVDEGVGRSKVWLFEGIFGGNSLWRVFVKSFFKSGIYLDLSQDLRKKLKDKQLIKKNTTV